MRFSQTFQTSEISSPNEQQLVSGGLIGGNFTKSTKYALGESLPSSFWKIWSYGGRYIAGYDGLWRIIGKLSTIEMKKPIMS